MKDYPQTGHQVCAPAALNDPYGELYAHLGRSLYDKVDPHVSDLFDILKQQPGYRDEDTPFVLKYEAYGGAMAPPGALTLQQHDIVHFLCGVNLVAYDAGQYRKDGERFLSGFQFGADPNFTDEHLAVFIKAVQEEAPPDYQFGKRGYRKLLQGVVLGRMWWERTGINLREFVQDAIDKNRPLDELYQEFWSKAAPAPENPINIERAIKRFLNEKRAGIEESCSMAAYLWPKGLEKRPGRSMQDRKMARFSTYW